MVLLTKSKVMIYFNQMAKSLISKGSFQMTSVIHGGKLQLVDMHMA